MRQRIRWFALHGVVRGLAKFGLRSGDPQARLVADPVVREDPAAFADQLRDKGPLIRCRAVLMTVDHGVAHELLRSDDFRVTELGGNLPKPLPWIAKKTDPGLLHPLRRAVAAVGRTARSHPVPQVGVVGVHPESRCDAAGAGRTDRDRAARRTRGQHRRRRHRRPLLLPTSGHRHRRRTRRARRRSATHPALRRDGCAQPRHRAVMAAVPAGAIRASSASTAGWPNICSSCAATPARI